MLHAPAHNVDRAKYYVIDVHNHVNDAMGIDDPNAAPERRRYHEQHQRQDRGDSDRGGFLFPFTLPTPKRSFTRCTIPTSVTKKLTEHPDWSFYGPQFPSKESVLAARDRLFAKHPHTTFVALHMANWLENLDDVSHLLDALPNGWLSSERAKPSWAASPGGLGNSSSSIRTASCSAPTRALTRPCTAIISGGRKPGLSILITGVIAVRDVGRFIAWNFRIQCWRRSTPKNAQRISGQFHGAVLTPGK